MLRRHIIVLLQIIVQFALSFIAHLKLKKTPNLTNSFPFSFLELCNMRGTKSTYFQNNISENDILSAAQLSTT